MAHSLSAKKRVRQNLKARARNRANKAVVRSQIKAYSAAVAGGDVAKAETELRKTTQVLDKVAAKKAIHKNTAARRRSRLTRKLNALKVAAKAAPAANA